MKTDDTIDFEPQLRARLLEHLDQSARDLDAQILARLRHARRAALEHAAERRRTWRDWLFPSGPWVVPAAALASIGVTVFAVALLTQQPSAPTGDGLDDLELLSSAGELEFLHDLEFYQWLPDA